MNQTFDEYSESYDDVMKKSIGFMGRKHDYYTEAKVEHLLSNLKKLYGDTQPLRVLDVGCGVGSTDKFLSPCIGDLCGVDVSPESIERARYENPQVAYEAYDGTTLPFEDEAFDAAFLICVMHHVLPEEHIQLLSEVRRVVRPGGAIFVFEHNPFHPLTRLVVARCEFDRDAQLLSRRTAEDTVQLAGFSLLDSQYILYLPFKLRILRGTDSMRRKLPFGTQYFVSALNPAK